MTYVCSTSTPGWNIGYGSIILDRYAEACDGLQAR